MDSLGAEMARDTRAQFEGMVPPLDYVRGGLLPLLASLVLLGCATAQSATPEAGKPWENSLGMKFVPIADALPLFAVWETRRQDFEAFVQATNHDATAGMLSDRGEGWKAQGDNWKTPGFQQTAQHPVCGVNWDDAKAFCAWLTKQERAAGQLGANQEYRLPTDDEWSAAVALPRETGATPRERNGKNFDVYAWGREFPPPKGAGNFADETARHGRHADYRIVTGYEDGFDDTSPVGSFTPNKFGLYDLAGNVWEWCEDFFDGRSGNRVLRGGCYARLGPHHLESAFRLDVAPVRRRADMGFRCVIAPVVVSP